MRWILILLATGLAVLAEAGAQTGGLDALIAREMPASGAPGMAFAVVGPEGTRTGAAGVTRIGGDDAVAAHTPFQLGSISKSITALAVMQLVETGQVALDAPVGAYLPAFEDRPLGAATVRQLLSHTSGLSTLQGNTTPGVSREAGSAAPGQAAAARIALLDPAAEPGARWAYSNANYVVLGALIEAVSGRSYSQYVQQEIFDPLEMTDSFVGVGEAHGEHASGHQPWFLGRRALKPEPGDPASAPAGGIVGSAADMALYLAAMVSGEDDVLSAQGKAAMLQPAGPQSPYYGFGWGLDPATGAAYHTGLTPGFETLAALRPQEGRAAVILVNGSGGFGFGETTQLRFALVNAGIGLEEPDLRAHWSRKLMYLSFALAPLLFAAGVVQAVAGRAGLRAKSGAFGLFSLWFPLLMTAVLAFVSLYLIPRLFGVTLGGLAAYQPDLVVFMIATAATGVIWALIRLTIAYTGKTAAA